ncbi:MAG: CvpA family protein [Spongiibacteraceae bacterium]
MNWADWTIVAILGISCLISLMRGFVREALSLIAWLAASFVAIAYHQPLADVFARWIETPSIRDLLAYLALFIGTLLVGTLINSLIGSMLKASGLTGFDRVLGLVFGAARGLLIVLALVILLPMVIPVNQDPWWRQSSLIPHFEIMEGWALETFSESVSTGKRWMQQIQSGQRPVIK